MATSEESPCRVDAPQSDSLDMAIFGEVYKELIRCFIDHICNNIV